MTAYRRVYDSHHLQADCQEPGSAMGYILASITGKIPPPKKKSRYRYKITPDEKKRQENDLMKIETVADSGRVVNAVHGKPLHHIACIAYRCGLLLHKSYVPWCVLGTPRNSTKRLNRSICHLEACSQGTTGVHILANT